MSIFAKGGYSNDRVNVISSSGPAPVRRPRSGNLHAFHVGTGAELDVSGELCLTANYD
jgi:hypothetical protein